MRLKVSEVKTGTDPKQWAIFERQKLIHDHIAKNGMKNPIVVNSNNELRFGGCRLQYAVLAGWEYIDAIVCDDQNEITRLQNEQSKCEYDFLPEQFIERKQSI